MNVRRARSAIGWVGIVAWGVFVLGLYFTAAIALIAAAYDFAIWMWQLGSHRDELWPFLRDDFWSFLRAWGGVLGLSLDILGAAIIYLGVRVTEQRALGLEWYEVHDIEGVTNSKLLERRRRIKRGVLERLRASRSAGAGLILLVIGFVFQFIGNWPKV